MNLPSAGPALIDNIAKLKASDSVMSVYIGYNNAKTYYERRRRRCTENWRYYWAHDPDLGLGQWPEQSVNYMIQQGRQLTQFNFIRVIVDTIAGGIMQLQFDPEFYPVNEEITTLTYAIKKAMYSDKELCDWDATYLNLVRDGLVQEGVIKMFIDRTYDELGNVGFRGCLPNSVFASPNWKTWSGKDCKKCWYDTWHSDEELIKLIPEQADYIKYQISHGHVKKAEEYGNYESATPYAGSGDMSGSQYRMTSQYDMVDEVEENEYAITENGDIEIPQDIPPEDRPEWLNKFHPTWSPEYVYTKPTRVKRCYVRSIIPALTVDRVVINKPTEIQIGRLPFFFWAASRANGESSSIVDSVKDPQMLINYMESLNLYKIQIEGGGGSQFADRTAFATNEEFQDYKANRNNPAKVFETKPGLLAEGKTPAIPTSKTGISNEAYQMINHLISVVLPQISKVTPAMRGLGEGQGESGKLYQLMKIQSDQQVYTIHYGLRIFWNEVYEAYFLQAADLYSQQQIQRTFSLNRGREKIVLNERVKDEDGQVIGIKNDVSLLRSIRHKVIISDKISSPAEKVEQLDAIGKFIQNLGGSSPLVTKFLVQKATQLMHPFDDDDKDTIEALCELDMENAVNATMLQNLQAKVQVLQWEDQLKQTIQAKEQKEAQERAGIPPGQPEGGQPQGEQGEVPAEGQQENAQPPAEGETPPAVAPFKNPTQESPVQIQPQVPPQPASAPSTIGPQAQGVPA